MSFRLESLEVRALLSAAVQSVDLPQAVQVAVNDIHDQFSPMTFTVDWQTSRGTSRAWLKRNSPHVVTPTGEVLASAFQSATAVGGNVRAMYTVASGDGEWNSADNGTYSIALRAKNSLLSDRALAQFQIDVADSMSLRSENEPFEVLLVWNNFQADKKIPESFIKQFDRPIWMNEMQWGFSNVILSASVGDNAADTTTLDAAFAHAQAHGNMVVVDLEAYWPVYDTWWYGGTGPVTPAKINIVNQHAAQALQFLQAVAARKPEGVKLAAYVPNGLMWGDRAQFEELIVHNFVGKFTPYLDQLVVDVYRHINDATPAIYGNRAANLIESYSELGLPAYGIAWPHATGTAMNDAYRDALIGGLKSSGAKGVLVWDDITRDWSFDIALMLTRFLSERVMDIDFDTPIGILPSLGDVIPGESLWNDVSKIL